MKKPKEHQEDKYERRYRKIVTVLGTLIAVEMVLFILLAVYLTLFTQALR